MLQQKREQLQSPRLAARSPCSQQIAGQRDSIGASHAVAPRGCPCVRGVRRQVVCFPAGPPRRKVYRNLTPPTSVLADSQNWRYIVTKQSVARGDCE